MRRDLIIVLAASFQLVYSSSILVDWSTNIVPDSLAYVLDYAPAVGSPPAGSTLGSFATHVQIKDTIPACEYTIYLSAIMPDGTRKAVMERTLYSSPDPPILDSIETKEHEAIISYFPPKEANITFHIEYYPEDQPEYGNIIETKASLVKLRGLDSGTFFRIKIRTIYNGIPSLEMIETSFRTEGTPEYDYSYSGEVFTVRTLPPGFDLATTTVSTDYDYSSEAVDTKNETEPLTTSPTTVTSTVENSTRVQATPTSTVVQMKAMKSTAESIKTTTTIPTTTTTTTTVTTPTATVTTTTTFVLATSSTKTPEVENIDENEILSMRTAVKKPKEQVIDTGDNGSEENQPLPVEQMTAEFGDPDSITMSPEENMIRLDWSVPDGSLCDAFLVNYTILSLTRPKSYSVATVDEFTVIKFFANHTLDIRVFCMLGGSLSKTWWAHRTGYMTSPQPVQSVRVLSSETDEFYVSRILVDWFWPVYHNFDLYKVVVEYGIGKAQLKEVDVNEAGPVLLDKLEPAQTYRIAVRNESIELGLKSKPSEIERITPPLISSTLYPGKITSTAININFGESDLEQGRFDHYELIFTGNNKNITKRIDINQEKSLTFTKLIPGKTYEFSLYTVFKGKRSRAVKESITTYPLKVNELFPVVGREYVILYWDVENFADSDCRFRLSYNADHVPTVSVELKDASRHRFVGLEADVYYTFTITVIMGTGKAAAESESEMITVYVPKGHLTPSVTRLGSRELSVTFENDHQVFSPLNGAISNIAVIVSDDTELNDDNYELKSWFEVSDEDTWGSYRASTSDWNPFVKNSRNATFTIGSDDCKRRSLDEPYCNGILRANIDYKVKLRAYMDNKVAMESDWFSIDGSAGGDGSAEDEDKNERRLPCHMYLNGCPRKSSTELDSMAAYFYTTTLFLLLL
ncbi:hypothetical protein RB195_020497 [Necator americanus]|uniref:protein-tyrosine-phosphatase n=1 Tax=Necator americanus TaxID=51031 RepID=A0ABR1CJG2_NECAM